MTFFIMMSTLLSIMFLLVNHPVSLSMLIFLQTIMVSIMCGMISNLFWFSYLMFMVMIGGLLILFLYMTNVASNEKFKPSKMIFFTALIPISFTVYYIFIDNFFFYNKISMWNNFLSNKSLELILMKYYSYPLNLIMLLVMILLMITMIMSVKMTILKKGALRQKY